jgi:cytochrome c oxidase subunit 3
MSVTSLPQRATGSGTGRIALLVTLGTESVLFATVLVAYAALRSQVNWQIPHTLTRLTVPLANNAILLASALMVWWSTRAIRRGNQKALRTGLLISLLLGLCFVAGQVFEFNHAGLRIDDQSFGGVFFTLIGFHAVHVLAGVFFLFINLLRATLGDFSARSYSAVELGSWFWYYVTAVWAVLFVTLYLI